jgi:hypothetical protein
LQKAPGKVWSSHVYPWFAEKDLGKKLLLAMWSSGAVAGAASPESGGLAHASGRERAREESSLPKGSVSGLSRVRERASEGAHRRPAAMVARSSASASSRAGIENGRRARLYWVLGEASGASVGSGGEWSDGSTAAAHMARWQALRRARGGLIEEWPVRARWPTYPFVGVARRTGNGRTGGLSRAADHGTERDNFEAPRCGCSLGRRGASGRRGLGMARAREAARGLGRRGRRGAGTTWRVEDHVWFEDRWMVASLCYE